MVDDLDNGSQAAGVRAVTLEEDDTANLNQAPVGCNDRSLGHCVGVCMRKVGISGRRKRLENENQNVAAGGNAERDWLTYRFVDAGGNVVVLFA